MLSYSAFHVLSGATLLGVIGGSLGGYALLRRQSLLGDALAHAALPGVCIAFFLTFTKSPFVLLTGALAAGLAGALLILLIIRWSKIKEDAAIGIILSVFFGAGIVLLTRLQKIPGGNQSGLDRFLFGQASALVAEDIRAMAILGALVLLVVFALYKEFKLISFDPGFAESMGLPVRRLEMLLTSLLVVVVVIGLQTVGVVLMVATLITPAAAARQWTERLGVMLILASVIGGLSGAVGALLSGSFEKLPTGPTIVLVSSAFLIVSLLFAPSRGLVSKLTREARVRDRIRRENLLKDLYRQGENAGDHAPFLSAARLMGIRGQRPHALNLSLRPLIREGLIEESPSGFRLTERGIAEAERVVRRHRLWEVYLARRLELPIDHVHRDAEAMEHALSDTSIADIEEKLGFPEVDPHGRAIPKRRPS